MRYVVKILCCSALACTAVLYSDVAFAQTAAPSELILTYPNGGEKLLAGGSAVIAWTGVAPEQVVRLDYSADAGRTWKTITPKATGLRYEWQNIPSAAAGTTTLVRVSKGTFADDYDPENPAPAIVWQKIIEGSYFLIPNPNVIQDDDGSLAISGVSEDMNLQVAKLNSLGKALWIKTIKVPFRLTPLFRILIQQSSTGNYVVGSNYYERRDGAVQSDFVVAELNKQTGESGFIVAELNKQTGKVEWSKTIHGSRNNRILSLYTLKDGNYLAIGFASSSDSEISDPNNKGPFTYCWIAKLEAGSGRVLQKNFLSLPDRNLFAHGGFEDEDGNYVVGVEARRGSNDAWLMKVKPKDGSTVWATHLGFSSINGSLKTRDGHYIVTGSAESVTSIKKVEAGTGAVVWTKTFGSNGDGKYLQGIIEATDGGYVIAGSQKSGEYNKDCWLLKLRPEDGSVQWSKTFGGSGSDWATSVVETDDGGYVMVGSTSSNDGDLKGYKKKSGDKDIWVVKLAEPQVEQVDISDRVFSVAQAEATSQDVQMGSCAVGSSVSVPVPDFIANTGSAPLAVESIAIQGADAAAFSILSPPPPYSIPAGSVRPVEFRFKPFKAGTHRAKVVIRTAQGTVTHTIEGTGARP